MSKTKLTVSIIIILSIAIGILSGVYFYTKKSTNSISQTSNDKTIFGGIGGVRTDLPPDNTNKTIPQETSNNR